MATFTIAPTPAPTLTNFSASAAIGGLKLKWDEPINSELFGTEIWSATTNNRASASLAATVTGSSYFYQNPTGSTVYFWIRSKNIYDRADGAWTPTSSTAGLSATAQTVVTNDIAANNITTITAAFDDTDYFSNSGQAAYSTNFPLYSINLVGHGYPAIITSVVDWYTSFNTAVTSVTCETVLEFKLYNTTTSTQVAFQRTQAFHAVVTSGGVADIDVRTMAPVLYRTVQTLTNGHNYTFTIEWYKTRTNNSMDPIGTCRSFFREFDLLEYKR